MQKIKRREIKKEIAKDVFIDRLAGILLQQVLEEKKEVVVKRSYFRVQANL